MSLAIVLVAVVLVIVLAGGGRHAAKRTRVAQRPTGHPRAPTRPPFAVGLRLLRLVDASRRIRLPDGGSVPRVLLTYVRYPALGARGGTDLRDAPPARAGAPFPLVVFGHGFDVTPGLYAPILRAWARAGYVVAAPVFPLENPDAPGGPDESDLINQPADMRFVISRLLSLSAANSGPLSGIMTPNGVGVAGQSDGGDTALAVAYDAPYRDPRVKAAVIFSGAEIPGTNGFSFAVGSPPLLAAQGTADTINPPAATAEFFEAAPRPKYLLDLPGAEHLPPYSSQEPQLGIVERVSRAFLDAYLKREPRALAQLARDAHVSGVSTLVAEP